jgi:hypothetical protein
LAHPFGPPSFVRNEEALDAVLQGLKLLSCPHCRKTEMLIGHGFLRGYAESSSERVVRGRRLFCSNRGLRLGCGRTFSVRLAKVIAGFVVRTLTVWCFAGAVLAGLTRRAAWLRQGVLSLSSGYRLWRQLSAQQSALRARLCRELPPPQCEAREPVAQLLAHLEATVGVAVGSEPADPFAAFQHRLQHGLFGA